MKHNENNLPEITVSMPAYNSGKYIAQAISSVLTQEGVNLELIIVDDCSTDNTVEIVNTFNDNRIKLVCNSNRMGIGYCHNLVLSNSTAPIISHVDSDDFILPGALKKMISKVREDSNIGQAHCCFFPVNELGLASRDEFRRRKNNYINLGFPEINYKSKLLVSGWIVNHLRTYRKDVLVRLGRFNENIKYGIDYDMSLRILDKYKIKLVPEMLYCYRMHTTNITGIEILKKLRMYFQKKRILWSLVRNNKVNFVNEIQIIKLVMSDFINYLHKLLIGKFKYIMDRSLFYYNVPVRFFKNLYFTIVPRFDWWPISLRYGNNHPSPKSKGKIAYYLWKYPVLSQTFIQREIKALIENGIDITVYAEERESNDLDVLIDNKLSGNIEYVTDPQYNDLQKYFIYFLIRKPIVSINLLLYVIFRKHSNNKKLAKDISVYSRAIYLAGKLKDNSINHVHSPWANQQAFVALIASKLLGIKFSVQARAYDIHRNSQKAGLKEIFENAEFIITNTDYNKEYISSIMTDINENKIKMIYNGLNLEQFSPNGIQNYEPFRILSVGRIVEQKGFEYLIRACQILKSENIEFKCEIIGEDVNPDYTNHFIILRKLINALGLDDNVFFLGGKPFKDVLQFYKKANIVVLPCVIANDGSRDIIPNILLESMAMKLPVVSTNITGVPEIVEDGTSGLLVPERDEHALAEAMKTLISNKSLRESMGINARKRVEYIFNIDTNIKQYIELFNYHSKCNNTF